MKSERNDAVNDPLAPFAISSVLSDLIQTEAARFGYEKTAPEEGARFICDTAL
ncbi:hypothetical protein [Nioella sediminis]|jgi:hypothetical protein|uniref:hypothetical protein n=1 Tax=Nioella sediminis TaxID=1912092 RepID=UPI000B04D0F2|nr:hypothetical protein [Nioella sediminis]